MKQVVSFIVISMTLMCCANRSEKLLKEAIELDSLGKYKEAILVYDELLGLDSLNASVLIARAYDKGQMGDSSGKIEDLKRSSRVVPNNTRALFELGIFYGDLGKYKESIEAFNKAIATKGNESYSMDFVKNDFFNNERYLLDIPFVDIKLERGIVYHKADSLRKAHFDLTYCISKGYELADSYYYRSKNYLKSEMLEHACRDAKKSLGYGMDEAAELVVISCK